VQSGQYWRGLGRALHAVGFVQMKGSEGLNKEAGSKSVTEDVQEQWKSENWQSWTSS
jgi:hypothetical protein